MMKFLNVYKVTREFGGYEEGGWYFDSYECVEVFPIRTTENAEMLEQWLYEQHAGYVWGDITSVRGGAKIVVYCEDAPKESETREIPQYE